jgi:hypothetical protein
MTTFDASLAHHETAQASLHQHASHPSIQTLLSEQSKHAIFFVSSHTPS